MTRRLPFFTSAGSMSVRRSMLTATTVTSGNETPVFLMLVFDTVVSMVGLLRIAMRNVAVVNCVLPSGNGWPAKALGTAAAVTPFQANVYVVSGRRDAAGVSRMTWLLKPALKLGVTAAAPAGPVTVYVPTGAPPAPAATGGENSICGLILVTPVLRSPVTGTPLGGGAGATGWPLSVWATGIWKVWTV